MDDAMLAFNVYRDQDADLSVEQVGTALRAIGYNPTDAEVMVSHVQHPYFSALKVLPSRG